MTKNGYLSGFNRMNDEQIMEEYKRLEKAGIYLDCETGRMYNADNIPMGVIFQIQYNDTTWRIFALDDRKNRHDAWYTDKITGKSRFIGTQYAVFIRKNDMQFWQQVTNWYKYYGTAKMYMNKMSKEA